MSLTVWLLTQCVELSMQKAQQAHAKTIYRYKQRNALKLDRLYLAFRQMADEHTHTLTLHRWAKSPKGRSALRCVWTALSLSCLCAKLSPLFSVGVSHSAVWLHTHHSTALKQDGQSPQDRKTRRERDGRGGGGIRETEQLLHSQKLAWRLGFCEHSVAVDQSRKFGQEPYGFMHSQLSGGSSPFLVFF